MVFEQSLSGLIKALRASKATEDAVIQSALRDISVEAKSPEWDVKAGAVLKLTYLEMLGQSHLAQYSFPVIECMSSPRLHIKQIGYLAASQSFAEHTDTILLTNNLIKKDLSTASASPASLLLTLSSLPPLLNSSPQLCDDLDLELQRQLTHSRPQVRSSAVLVLGSVWKRHYPLQPDLAEFVINKLADRLVDQDPSVVCSAVNVMLEIARTCDTDEQKAPFLRLAPECFELLTSSQNNWMLIKVIKLFAILTPIEPRLVRKLLPPLTNLISTTPAMSLLYECIHAVIVGNMLADNENLASVCINKLSNFLSDADQNLRYIALLSLTKLLPTHSHHITPHSDIILKCVDDPDTSIRMRALELLEGMADRSSLQTIVKKLLSHFQPPAPSAKDALAHLAAGSSIPSLANPEYKASLISRILRITTHASYAHISNFHWFIDLLVQLARLAVSLPSTSSPTDNALGAEIARVLIDVCARVRALRPYAISQCLTVLLPEALLTEASAWVVGEYAVEGIEWPKAIGVLRDAGCLYAAIKVLARWCAALEESEGYEDAEQLGLLVKAAQDIKEDPGIAQFPEFVLLLDKMLANLAVKPQPAATSSYAEEENPFASGSQRAEDRSASSNAPSGLRLLPSVIFPYDLNPVNERAQSLVQVPEGLDLDAWIHPGSIAPLPNASASLDDVDEYGRPRGGFRIDSSVTQQVLVPKKSKKSKAGGERDADGKKKKKKKKRHGDQLDSDDIDSIPIVKLDLNGVKPDKPRREARPRTPTPPPVFVDVEGELPPVRVSTPLSPVAVKAVEEQEEPIVAASAPAAVQVVKKKKKRPKQPA